MTFDPKLRWCLSFVAYARLRARGVIGADTTCPCSPRKIVLVIHTDNVLSQLALCSPGLGPPSAHGRVTKSDKSPKSRTVRAPPRIIAPGSRSLPAFAR